TDAVIQVAGGRFAASTSCGSRPRSSWAWATTYGHRSFVLLEQSRSGRRRPAGSRRTGTWASRRSLSWRRCLLVLIPSGSRSTIAASFVVPMGSLSAAAKGGRDARGSALRSELLLVTHQCDQRG